MPKGAITAALILGTLAVLATGLLFLVGTAHGGPDWDHLPIIGGIICAALALGWGWIYYFKGKKIMMALGLLPLALVLLVNIPLLARMVTIQSQSEELAQQIALENYRETPITWEGFDGPVGLEISFDLITPPGASGMLYPPLVWMGDTPSPQKQEALADAYFTSPGMLTGEAVDGKPGKIAVLKPIVQQKMHEEKYATRLSGERMGVTYHLYPGIVASAESQNHLCFNNDAIAAVNELRYQQGTSLTALWFIARRYGMAVDISPRITAAIRSGGFQYRPAQWEGMLRRLEPFNLSKLGWRACSGQRESFRQCFCKQ